MYGERQQQSFDIGWLNNNISNEFHPHIRKRSQPLLNYEINNNNINPTTDISGTKVALPFPTTIPPKKTVVQKNHWWMKRQAHSQNSHTQKSFQLYENSDILGDDESVGTHHTGRSLRLKKTVLKIVILGNSGVGKTSLINHYNSEHQTGQHKTTIGADFISKTIYVTNMATSEVKACTLQIWDTAGQERFQSLGKSFYRGSDACILVYDVTNKKSFDSLEIWRNEFLNHMSKDAFINNISEVGRVGMSIHTCGQHDCEKIDPESCCRKEHLSDFPFVVLGNKIDKEISNERTVSFSSLNQWCQNKGGNIPHFETSAKLSINVHEAFMKAASMALTKKDEERKNELNVSIISPDIVELDYKGTKETKELNCWKCC